MLKKNPFWPDDVTHATIVRGDSFLPDFPYTPNTLTHLSLEGGVVLGALDKDFYSKAKKLTHLYMESDRSLFIASFPPNITHLIFGDMFNSSKINDLPHSLVKLKFGNQFNFPIDNLPPNLKKLSLGRKFNQPLTCSTRKRVWS